MRAEGKPVLREYNDYGRDILETVQLFIRAFVANPSQSARLFFNIVD